MTTTIITTTIQKWGNSQGIRLPKQVLEQAGMNESDQVDLSVEDGILVIRKSKFRHKTLEERLSGYEGKYIYEEWDTGKPVGNEVW